MAHAFYDESDNDFSEDENDDIGSGSDIDFDSDFEAMDMHVINCVNTLVLLGILLLSKGADTL